MSAHTPGPWIIWSPRSEHGVYEVGPDGSRVAIIRDVRRFGADGDIDPATERLPRANADLIAAAPDLLAALEEAALQIEYLHEKFKPTGSGNAVLARIAAAIAKAKGTPPCKS